jgi:integrin beta 3
MLETKALAEATAAVVREQLAPLLARLDALEAQAPQKGEPGEPGEAGRDGRDGVGLAGALIDRTGALVLTLTDGTTRELGPVVGKDGTAGRDGVGTPGTDGKDGVDGLGFDDLTFEHDGERGFTLRFVQGDRTKEFAFEVPVVLDRGVWKEGAAYAKGDAVTWAGSLWIAQKDTDSKPEGGDGWRLAVKRGRDGKDKA